MQTALARGILFDFDEDKAPASEQEGHSGHRSPPLPLGSRTESLRPQSLPLLLSEGTRPCAESLTTSAWWVVGLRGHQGQKRHTSTTWVVFSVSDEGKALTCLSVRE